MIASITVPGSKGTGTFTDVVDVGSFNVASVTSNSGTTITINFAQAFANSTYAVIPSFGSNSAVTVTWTRANGSVTLGLNSLTPSTTSFYMSLVCFGIQ